MKREHLMGKISSLYILISMILILSCGRGPRTATSSSAVKEHRPKARPSLPASPVSSRPSKTDARPPGPSSDATSKPDGNDNGDDDDEDDDDVEDDDNDAAARPKPICTERIDKRRLSTRNVFKRILVRTRGRGRTGKILITERGNRRQLVINGVVQAELPRNLRSSMPDVMVQLIKAARPNAETALVVGLGSGNTARALAESGIRVDAVEIEPKVIEYARRYFGYKGHAAAGDGLDFLRKSWRVYDVILMDAFVGACTPAHLFTKKAMRLIDSRLALGGLLAVRLLGSPAEKQVNRLYDAITLPTRAFGSGTADEVQNLYFLASRDYLDLVAPKGIPVWPVLITSPALDPDQENPHARDLMERKAYLHRYHRSRGSAPRGFRHVVLLGYLAAVGKKKTLCLDLPYQDMGALRVVLKGRAAAGLRRLVSSIRTFPTSGALSTDGDTSRTMKHLLGGDTCMGDDTRYSPVALAVEGNMVLIARQGAYAMWTRRVPKRFGPFLYRPPYEPLLPFGGHLYELSITKVHLSLTYEQWQQFKKTKLDPQLDRAAAFARKRRVREFLRAFAGYVALLRSRFGKASDLLAIYTRAQKLLAEWKRHLKSLPKRLDMDKAASACYKMEQAEDIPAVIKKALERCTLPD